MLDCSYAHYPDLADARGAAPGAWGYRPHNLPTPVKAAVVVVGFLLFKPLGLAALIYFLVDARRRHRFPGGFAARREGASSTGNSAFDERRREVLSQLDADAKAFAEFTRQQREARDREAFERFQRERGAGGESAPKA